MDLTQIPLFAALKGKMVHTSQRQRVIAENVANADVPNFTPKDLKPFTFDEQLKSAQSTASVGMARTADSQMDLDLGNEPSTSDATMNAPDSELRLDGNHVVLEEQMVKMNEAQGDYAAAVSFYEQSLSLLKTAISKPGG